MANHFYPASRLFAQADNLTEYAKSLGYSGTKPVLVLDGKLISHRGIDWFEFCASLRAKQSRKERACPKADSTAT